MPRGRRPGPGTSDERAAARREKVRLNVQAFRRRQQGLKQATEAQTKPSLKWVEDAKWQSAYNAQEQLAENDSSSDSESRTNSLATNSDSWSFVYETPTTEASVGGAGVPGLRRLQTPDNSKQHLLALLSIFPRRFLPDRISLPSSTMVDEIRTPCALWVTTAYSRAKQQASGPLNDVLLAITTALASLEMGRDDLKMAAGRLYQRSLQGTRRQLQPIIDHGKSLARADTTNVFLACHAASVFELYVNRSFADMNRHVRGIGLLIEHQRQSSGLPSYIGDCLLEEYRMLEIGFCLMDRRLSAMNRQPKSLTPLEPMLATSRPEPKPGVSIFTTLLDLGDHIPLVMVKVDALKQFPISAGRDQKLKSFIHTLLSVETQLEAWSRYLQYKCTSGLSPGSQDGVDLPGNEIDLAAISSYDYACSWLFCLSYANYALEEVVEVTALLSEGAAADTTQRTSEIHIPREQDVRTKLIDSAGRLAQLTHYFFQPEQGIIGRSLAIWPLEAAWNALDIEWTRLQSEEAGLGVEDDVAKSERDRRKAEVKKYLHLCRKAGAKGQSYGLPLMKSRE